MNTLLKVKTNIAGYHEGSGNVIEVDMMQSRDGELVLDIYPPALANGEIDGMLNQEEWIVIAR